MRVRKIGAGSLVWGTGSISGGEVRDVPLEVVERYSHRLELLEDLPPIRPVVSDAVEVKSKSTPKTRKPRKRVKKAG